MKRWILIFVLAATAVAQTPSPGATPIPGIFSGITLALAQPPQPVAAVSVHIAGNPGNATFYYWIVTNEIIGSSSPSGPWIAPDAPSSPSATDSIALSWSPVAGAISYDVLRTTSPAAPAGACNCAVATAVATTSATDRSATLSAYTVQQFDPNTVAWTIQTVPSAAGISKVQFAVKGGPKFSVDSTGQIQAPSIEQVRYADQWCATPGTYDQSCIANAAASLVSGPGAGIVVVQPHAYTISSTLTIPSGIHVQGDWRWPAGATFGMGTPAASSAPVFSVTVGAGSTTTPAVIMNAFSGLSGVEFYYPNQVTSGTPIPYGWSIAFSGGASNDKVVISDILLVNSYLGIYANYGGQWQLDNIYGTPLSVGIQVDQVYDGAEMHNVHFWTTFWQSGLDPWIQANGTAILLNRIDGLNAEDIEAFGYYRGLDFEASASGTAWAHFGNFIIDGCTQPIYIGAANIVTLTNGSLSGDFSAGYLWGITTSSSVGLRANINVENVVAYALFGLAYITSSNGTFSFSNVSGRRPSDNSYTATGNGDLVGPLVVNASTAAVMVSGTEGSGPAQLAATVWGPGPNTTVDGVPFPATGTNVTPGTWSTFDSTFNLSSALTSVEDTTYVGPGVYVLSGSVSASNVAGAAQFYLRFETGAGTNTYAVWPYAGVAIEGWPGGSVIPFSVPVVIGANASALLELIYGGGTGGTVTISGLSLYKVASGTDVVRLSGLLYGGQDYLDPTSAGLYYYFSQAKLQMGSSYLSGGNTINEPSAGGTLALTSQLPLAGTTANIGGSALAAGTCTTGTVAVTGATSTMAVAVSPAADPGTGFAWEGWVSAAGTVTVRVCNVTSASLTPTAEAYNVRVIQ